MERLDYLWYIIPGILSSFPLFFVNKFIFLFQPFGIPFLVLAFTIGYVIHQIYRVIYYFFLRDSRPLIGFLNGKLKMIDINVRRSQTEYLYNYFLYSSEKEEIKSRVDRIKQQSYFLSSIFSSILALIIGMVFIKQYLIDSFLFVIYYILFIVLSVEYTILFYWMNNNEKTLVKFHFSEFRNKKNDIINKFIKEKI